MGNVPERDTALALQSRWLRIDASCNSLLKHFYAGAFLSQGPRAAGAVQAPPQAPPQALAHPLPVAHLHLQTQKAQPLAPQLQHPLQPQLQPQLQPPSPDPSSGFFLPSAV